MAAILRRIFCYSGSDKQDDDVCLLEVDNWQKKYPPALVGANPLPLDQEELRIKTMVSQLTSFRNLERVEDLIADHFCNIVRQSCSEVRLEVRRYLITALVETSLERSLKSRLQTTVERSLCVKQR